MSAVKPEMRIDSKHAITKIQKAKQFLQISLLSAGIALLPSCLPQQPDAVSNDIDLSCNPPEYVVVTEKCTSSSSEFSRIMLAGEKFPANCGIDLTIKDIDVENDRASYETAPRDPSISPTVSSGSDGSVTCESASDSCLLKFGPMGYKISKLLFKSDGNDIEIEEGKEVDFPGADGTSVKVLFDHGFRTKDGKIVVQVSVNGEHTYRLTEPVTGLTTAEATTEPFIPGTKGVLSNVVVCE